MSDNPEECNCAKCVLERTLKTISGTKGPVKEISTEELLQILSKSTHPQKMFKVSGALGRALKDMDHAFAEKEALDANALLAALGILGERVAVLEEKVNNSFQLKA